MDMTSYALLGDMEAWDLDRLTPGGAVPPA
jgi:hypothetical protein